MDKSSDNVMFPGFCLTFTEGSRLFLSQFLNILQKLSTKKKTVMIHFFMLGYVFDKKTHHNSTLPTLQTQQTPRLSFSLILNSHLEQFCQELIDSSNNLDDIISDCEKVEDFEVYGKSEID